MGLNEFRRLQAACLDLAGQSNVPGIRDRWLTMAQGWVELADNVDQSLQSPRDVAAPQQVVLLGVGNVVQ
jgi:hypothetical protein